MTRISGILSIVKDTCDDINLYYKHSRLPMVIKRYIIKNKYKKLEDSIKRIKDSGCAIHRDLFYEFLEELSDMEIKEIRSKYNCYKLVKKIKAPDDHTVGNDYAFFFRLELNDISDENMKYSADIYGDITKDVLNVRYELITTTNSGDKHLISAYAEITDELLDGLVTLPYNTNNTTISYKMMYAQNYFANHIFKNVYGMIDEYIESSKKKLEET